MSRNKRLCAALLLAAVCAALMGSSLLDEESRLAPEAAYTTVSAARGSFTKAATSGAGVYWPVIVDVRNEVREARLDSIAIGRMTELSEGDYLGSIRSEGSRAALTEARLALERLREELSVGQAEREEALLEAEQALSGLDASALAAARLRLEKQRLELERYLLQQRRAIAAQEKAVRSIEEGLEGQEVYAPVSGGLDYFSYVSEGDSLYYGQRLLSIRRADTYLLRVEDGQDRFRYGMAVTVEYGPRNARRTVPGRVVSSDSVRRYNDTTGYAWIRLDEFIPASDLNQPSVSAESMRVDGVLLIPRAAARLTAGKQMVSILEGASIANRYVNIAMNNTEFSWVLQGLDEGQTLVLD